MFAEPAYAVLRSHVFSELDGLKLLECLRVLTVIERLEATGSPTAVRQERKLFALLWNGLQLER